MYQHGGANLADLLRGGGRAVERHRGRELAAHRDREEIGDAAAPTKTGNAQLSRRQRVSLQEVGAVQHVLPQLALIEAALQLAAVVVVAGIAADRREPVRRQRQEALHREPAGDVLDVGVQPPVLVHHQHDGKRPFARGLHQVAAHLTGGAARRRVFHVAGLDALVREGNGLRLGVTRKQRLRHGEAGDAGHAQGSRPTQELTPADITMTVLVVEIEYLPIDSLSVHRSNPLRRLFGTARSPEFSARAAMSSMSAAVGGGKYPVRRRPPRNRRRRMCCTEDGVQMPRRRAPGTAHPQSPGCR